MKVKIKRLVINEIKQGIKKRRRADNIKLSDTIAEEIKTIWQLKKAEDFKSMFMAIVDGKIMLSTRGQYIYHSIASARTSFRTLIKHTCRKIKGIPRWGATVNSGEKEPNYSKIREILEENGFIQYIQVNFELVLNQPAQVPVSPVNSAV